MPRIYAALAAALGASLVSVVSLAQSSPLPVPATSPEHRSLPPEAYEFSDLASFQEFVTERYCEGCEISYPAIESRLTDAHRTWLYEAISDPAHREHWNKIALLIGWFGSGESAATALIDSIKHYDHDAPPTALPSSKRFAVTMLGYVDDPAGDALLHKWSTLEGAKALVEQWQKQGSLGTTTSEAATYTVRHGALTALALSSRPENRAWVEDEYQRVVSEITAEMPGTDNAGEALRVWIDGNSAEASYHNALVSAMAYRDLVDEYGGIDAFLAADLEIAEFQGAFIAHMTKHDLALAEQEANRIWLAEVDRWANLAIAGSLVGIVSLLGLRYRNKIRS